MSEWSHRLRSVAYLVSTVAFVVCAAFAVIAWTRADAPVPVHWDWRLRPDRYGSKAEGLLLPVSVLVLLVAVFHRASGSADRGHGAEGYVLWIALVAPLGVVLAMTAYSTAVGSTSGTSPAFMPVLVALALVGYTIGVISVRQGERGEGLSDQSPPPDRRYWFKAKRWGWGWGRPCSWEGWAISLAYLAAVLASSTLGPARRPLNIAVLLLGTPLLLWACVARGEPARWRWGGVVEIETEAVEPTPERPAVVRPDPEPFKPGDPRDAVRAEIHRRMTQSAGIDPWDYLESIVRGELLIVRLREDDGRLITIEVELADPVTPESWDLLDVWIDEFMWTGRSAPISTTDTETTYRFE